mmetsp:Transcript_45418/g.58230  ORF Transcript_45418/g.58230 Transcript_45418/m.58230 type:complete len:108 (+) Transcript_45418:1096-1419(+)
MLIFSCQVLHQQQAIKTDVILQSFTEIEQQPLEIDPLNPTGHMTQQETNSSHSILKQWRVWLKEDSQRRIWRYWLERTAMIMGHGPPTGLYNPSVRARFKRFMEITS